MISAGMARLGQVLTSWILAPDDVVLTITRNYNKKSAVVQLDQRVVNLTSGGRRDALKSVFYPLNWQQGDLMTKDNMQVVLASSKANAVSDSQLNIEWINQSSVEVNRFPGGDKWVIGKILNFAFS